MGWSRRRGGAWAANTDNRGALGICPVADYQIDAKGAAMDADLTEAYAYDAIDEAEYAVLDAMYARAAAAAVEV